MVPRILWNAWVNITGAKTKDSAVSGSNHSKSLGSIRVIPVIKEGEHRRGQEHGLPVRLEERPALERSAETVAGLARSLIATVHGHCLFALNGTFALMGEEHPLDVALARVRESIAAAQGTAAPAA